MPASENNLVDLRPGGRITRDDVQYSEADGCFHVQVHLVGRPRHILGADIDEVAAQANDLIEGQSPHLRFLDVWKEGVALFPEYFNSPDEGIQSAQDIYQLAPKIDKQTELSGLSDIDLYFVSTMWTFFFRRRPQTVREPITLPPFAELAEALDIQHKEILARLFVNFRPRPQA